MMPLLVAGVLAAVAATILTRLVWRHAISRSLLDHPNERSSHSVPTPRGGGLAIAVCVIPGTLVIAFAGLLAWNAAIGLAGGALLVALIGWADDLRPRSAWLRASVHVLAAAWLLGWTGGAPSMILVHDMVPLGWVGTALAIGAIVWSINLYNFMDGIDGLAGGQAVLLGLAGTFVLAGTSPGLALVAALTAGSALGFLRWNWHPARIFLGDVGSGLCGFLFAAIALGAVRGSGPGVITWVMFGGVFLADATITLARRALRGERWYAAHRSHAYQRAVISGWRHSEVTTGALALTLLGVILAWVGWKWPQWFWPGVVAQSLLLSIVLGLIERRAPMSRP